jgi:hypothetical protein
MSQGNIGLINYARRPGAERLRDTGGAMSEESMAPDLVELANQSPILEAR